MTPAGITLKLLKNLKRKNEPSNALTVKIHLALSVALNWVVA
jgi:hypothetical protein